MTPCFTSASELRSAELVSLVQDGCDHVRGPIDRDIVTGQEAHERHRPTATNPTSRIGRPLTSSATEPIDMRSPSSI